MGCRTAIRRPPKRDDGVHGWNIERARMIGVIDEDFPSSFLQRSIPRFLEGWFGGQSTEPAHARQHFVFRRAGAQDSSEVDSCGRVAQVAEQGVGLLETLSNLLRLSARRKRHDRDVPNGVTPFVVGKFAVESELSLERRFSEQSPHVVRRALRCDVFQVDDVPVYFGNRRRMPARAPKRAPETRCATAAHQCQHTGRHKEPFWPANRQSRFHVRLRAVGPAPKQRPQPGNAVIRFSPFLPDSFVRANAPNSRHCPTPE